MATFTLTQYQQVQAVMQQIVALAQQPALWAVPAIQQSLTTAYQQLDSLASYIAAQGSN